MLRGQPYTLLIRSGWECFTVKAKKGPARTVVSRMKSLKMGRSFAENGFSRFQHRVTHQVVVNLPFTSKQKFGFGLARPGQARPQRNFCFEVNGRF